jgi:hypothetical protein
MEEKSIKDAIKEVAEQLKDVVFGSDKWHELMERIDFLTEMHTMEVEEQAELEAEWEQALIDDNEGK